ncbi:MAG: hypothetical protein NPINA01_14550 [Nitrospinaceae bacterium]|nr:MAG: hypothetical protein NPINA01_14550 [Nitrospinaceae bacterium]
MNVERLIGLIEILLKNEKEINIQENLTQLNTALTNFVATPSEPSYQIEVSEKVEDLEKNVSKMVEMYDPPQMRLLDRIGALEYFGEKVVQNIKETIRENSMTPAVVEEAVRDLLKNRENYIETLNITYESLTALNIEADYLEEGSAEIGFQLPRDIFKNELDGLIKELRVLKRIIRAFSEVSTGSVEPIEIRQGQSLF